MIVIFLMIALSLTRLRVNSQQYVCVSICVYFGAGILMIILFAQRHHYYYYVTIIATESHHLFSYKTYIYTHTDKRSDNLAHSGVRAPRMHHVG